MASLLPKLRKTHIDSNIMLTGRQEKILAILKGDQVSPTLNDGKTSRKFFRKGSDMSSMGADLQAVASTRFPGAGSKAFMTTVETPGKTNRMHQSTMEQTNFKKRHGSLNPSMQFQTGREDIQKNGFLNRTIDAAPL